MRSLFRTLNIDTTRDIALVCLADSIVGVSFGAIAVAGGLPLWFPVSLSILVFAGGAQFATIGVLLAGGNPLAAAITGIILNGRLLAYGFAIHDVFGTSRVARLLGAHLIVDESVAFAMRQETLPKKKAAFWISGVLLFVVWNVAVLLGAVAAKSFGDASRLGLDATFPALLLALIWPAMSDRRLLRKALSGGGLAIIGTQILVPGLGVMLALVALVPTAWRTFYKSSDSDGVV